VKRLYLRRLRAAGRPLPVRAAWFDPWPGVELSIDARRLMARVSSKSRASLWLSFAGYTERETAALVGCSLWQAAQTGLPLFGKENGSVVPSMQALAGVGENSDTATKLQAGFWLTLADIRKGGSIGRSINRLSVRTSRCGSILRIRCSKSAEYLSRKSVPGPMLIPRLRDASPSVRSKT